MTITELMYLIGQMMITYFIVFVLLFGVALFVGFLVYVFVGIILHFIYSIK